VGPVVDAETGLQYLRARYYDPATGQFLTRDPLVAMTSQPYAYANNSPLNYTDPSGEFAWLAVAAVVWAVAEVVSTGADAVSTVQTFTDPCASGWDKAASGGLFAAGAVLPGGGYSTGASVAKKASGRLTNDVARIKPGSSGGVTAGQGFPSSVRRQALEENPKTCVFCRMETSKPQVDHAIPRAHGGNATLDNAQTACPWCNASKGPRNRPVNPPPGYEGGWPPSWWGP
jgi:RHS repeat-associated protein